MFKAVFVSVVALLFLTGCGDKTQVERQDNADQIFGTAKVIMADATWAVSLYNLFPVCDDNAKPPLCYSEPIGKILNTALAAGADLIASTEKVFAAANSDPAAKLSAAKAARAAFQEIMLNVVKYGLPRKMAG